MSAHPSLLPDCDETHWPLAILVAETPLDADGVEAGFDTVERWLKREQPFALLLIAACEFASRSDVCILPMVSPRIELIRERLHRSLLGLAVVAPASTVAATRQGLARLRLDMPLEVFEKGSLAVGWLCASALAPAGLVIDSL